MKIKTKIRLGLLFLLAIIITLAITGSIYVNKLADISSAISKDNYESLHFTKNMIQALDEGDDEFAVKKFEQNLVAQENNITEVGEKDATHEMRELFELYKSGKRDERSEQLLRQKILNVQELNMQAIFRKNQAATLTTKRVFAYITILGTLCFLLSFTFVVNFPGMIANPIAELTAGIKEITKRNYSLRLNFKANDEFGDVANAFNEMARRLNEYENSNIDRLMFEKKRIEAIINNMRDAIIGLDDKNKVLFANTIAVQLLGSHESDLVGKYAPDVALHNDLLRSLLVKDEKEKVLKIYADQKESYFTKDILEIKSAEQKIGEVIVLRNVTRFRELDVAKTNFIATISHELKTPISSIKMSLKLLDDDRIGIMNTEQRKLVDNIKGDTQRLLNITTELLDMTQVESGNIQLNINKVATNDIIKLAVEAVTSLSDQKSVKINIEPGSENGLVHADLDKSVWVMVNLLTNAIRYAPANSTINVTVKANDEQMLFQVKDEGPGIEEKYIAHVFERYFKTPGSQSGTGLGLAICKEFIEAQGGKIWVDSTIGKGATFSFSLNT
jgi:signal transduction histidine kinase/HAMP domain-containing protein